MTTAQIEGASVTFRHDAGPGPTLVCLHGSADNHHVYDALLDALSGPECYAINMPGRAGTDGPPLSTVADMEAFLSDFVGSQLEGNYVVVGHSLGGAVAIEHALKSPPRLKGLVLLATGARLRVHPMILQLFEQVKASGQKIPPLPPGLYEQGTDPLLVEKASRDRELTPIETGGADWRAADAFDRMSDLAGVEVPALILVGTNDALTPIKYAEFMSAHIPHTELHVIEGAGHMFVMEWAEEVAGRIEGFVERVQ